jgi:hypothetical protein
MMVVAGAGAVTTSRAGVRGGPADSPTELRHGGHDPGDRSGQGCNRGESDRR